MQSSIDPWEKFGLGFFGMDLWRGFSFFFGLGRCFSLPVFPFKSVFGGFLLFVSAVSGGVSLLA